MPTDRNSAKPRQRLVILVDADEQSRRVCRTALSDAGFEVITASDAATALLVARIIKPDIVLLDVDVPALSSLVFARDMRADDHLRESQIIALTGKLVSQEHHELQATGFDQILVKPADQQRLLETVGGALAPA
ncbi:MAG TPA: response regulator [Gemmatimonadaceae bacterium]|jgi:DNA-binding response OmpR family regulator|nr:response regulator [Gemmatimonadaceae bacterium]